MTRRSIVLAVAVTGVVGTAAAPAQAATRSCSNTYGGDVVSATNVSCRQAHKLTNGWARNVKRDGRYDRAQFGFTCRNKPSSVEGATIFCRKGSQRVRWYVNLP